MPGAYYNEHDPYAAEWLRRLVAAGLIPAGDVDERDIRDVRRGDLVGHAQCHFFAGIAGWALALRLAGWPDDQPVWTASVPCQPYSIASVAHGGAQGDRDSRDLWPIFFSLARECRPPVLFGEQVPGAIGWGWWDRAALDLEGESYAAAALILRADAFGARHERRRIYWMADAGSERRPGHKPIQRFPLGAEAALAKYGDPLAGAGRALDGDLRDVLLSDGLSVAVERLRARGYGNAIVPQVAAEFVDAFMSAAE